MGPCPRCGLAARPIQRRRGCDHVGAKIPSPVGRRLRHNWNPRQVRQRSVGSKGHDPMTQILDRHWVGDKSQVEVSPCMLMTELPLLCPAIRPGRRRLITTLSTCNTRESSISRAEMIDSRHTCRDLPSDDARPMLCSFPSSQEGLLRQQTGRSRADKSPKSLHAKHHDFGDGR